MDDLLVEIKKSDATDTIACRIPIELKESIEAYTIHMGVSKSDFLKGAITSALDAGMGREWGWTEKSAMVGMALVYTLMVAVITVVLWG